MNRSTGSLTELKIESHSALGSRATLIGRPNAVCERGAETVKGHLPLPGAPRARTSSPSASWMRFSGSAGSTLRRAHCTRPSDCPLETSETFSSSGCTHHLSPRRCWAGTGLRRWQCSPATRRRPAIVFLGMCSRSQARPMTASIRACSSCSPRTVRYHLASVPVAQRLGLGLTL